MDAATGAMIIMGLQTFGKPAAQVMRAFVNATLAPTVKAIGTDFAQSYNEWRERRAARVEAIVLKSAGVLEAANLQPQPDILMPILEKASFVDRFPPRSRSAVTAAAFPSGCLSRVSRKPTKETTEWNCSLKPCARSSSPTASGCAISWGPTPTP